MAEIRRIKGPGRSRGLIHTGSWLGAEPTSSLTSRTQKLAAQRTFLGVHTNAGGRDPSLDSRSSGQCWMDGGEVVIMSW